MNAPAEVKVIDLPTQITAARRELAMRKSVYPHHIERKKLSEAKAAEEIANMEAIIRTLEWLYANEDRIRAKVQTVDEHDALPMPVAESTNTYRFQKAMFLDMTKGGYEQRREVVDEAGNVLGVKIEGRETRDSKPYVHFVPVGFRTYDKPGTFIAAYERGEWKAREAEGERQLEPRHVGDDLCPPEAQTA